MYMVCVCVTHDSKKQTQKTEQVQTRIAQGHRFQIARTLTQTSAMTNTKLPIKLAEVAVQRFNAPASGVPHHVGLLAGHRASVERCLAAGDWDKVRREQINATRVIKQLKCMLVEMAELRERIRDADVPKYDELVRPGRERALAAINAYLREYK